MPDCPKLEDCFGRFLPIPGNLDGQGIQRKWNNVGSVRRGVFCIDYYSNRSCSLLCGSQYSWYLLSWFPEHGAILPIGELLSLAKYHRCWLWPDELRIDCSPSHSRLLTDCWKYEALGRDGFKDGIRAEKRKSVSIYRRTDGNQPQILLLFPYCRTSL